MTLIKKEFLARRTSLIVYCLVIILMTWMYIGLYPTIQAQSAALTKAVSSFGPTIKAFGIKAINFDTLENFLAVELFGITWPVLAITFVIARAGQSLAGETEKGTIGTLLALPISRARLYLSKYLAGLGAIVIFVAATSFTAPLIASAYHIANLPSRYLTVSVLCLLFSWAIYSLAMLFSAIFDEKGRVYTVTGGLLLVMYVANVITELTDKIDWLKYGSFFHYFAAATALSTGKTDPLAYTVFGGVIVATFLAGLIWFTRKNVIV